MEFTVNSTAHAPNNRHIVDMPPPSSLPAGRPNTSASANLNSTEVWANAMAVGWVFVLLYCCCCKRQVPGRDHWRGAEIRRRFQELQARERAREEKEQQTPAYRRKLVQHNMRSKRVIAKDHDGNFTLGNVHRNADTTVSGSPAHNDTLDLEEEDNENEHACVICLDSFQVGDIVSWSRFSEDCHHVFHAECIEPWLEGKRQDECPSCRNRLMMQEPPTLDDLENNGGTENLQKLQEEDYQDEPSDREDDSFFVSVHGLIVQAARRASYSFMGASNTHDKGAWNATGRLPPASPLRRVVSHEPTRSPPTFIVGGMRRTANDGVPAGLSLHTLMRHDDSSAYRQIRTTGSSDLDEEAKDTPGDLEAAIYPIGSQTASPIPFRRVQSDFGTPSPRQYQQHLRRYPMFQDQKKNPVMNTAHSEYRPTTTSDDEASTASPPEIRRGSVLVLEHPEHGRYETQDTEEDSSSASLTDDSDGREEGSLEWLVPSGGDDDNRNATASLAKDKIKDKSTTMTTTEGVSDHYQQVDPEEQV